MKIMQTLKKQSKNRKFSRKKTLLILSALFLVFAAGVAAYALLYKNKADEPSKIPNYGTAETKPSTHESTSEGSTFPIPNDVSKDAIKDYSLVTENEQFKIRHDGASDEYLITLYPIVNNPSQQSTYQDQLREYKQAALNYLKQQGKDVSKLKIKYEPEEANNL